MVAGLSQNLDAVGVSTDDGKLDSDYRKLNNDHVSQSNAGQSAEPAMILKGKSLSDTDISQKFREPEPRQGQGQGQGAPRQGQGMQRKEQGGVLLVAGNADNLVRELHHGGNSVNDGYLGDTPVCDDVAVTQPQELRVPEGGVLAQVDSNDEGFAMVEHGYRLEVDDNYSVLTVHSTSSSSADDACSYDSRFEMLDTIAVPLRRLPNTYIMDLVIAVELEYFGTRHDVRGDGQCGYYSIMHSLILHFRRVSPNHPSLNDEFSEVSFRKATWFRYMLYEYINQHYDELVAEKSPIIVDQDGLQVTDWLHTLYLNQISRLSDMISYQNQAAQIRCLYLMLAVNA